MLLDPGGALPFNGQTLTYPDIRLIYWAGGNPFHHHQDLNRLRRWLRASRWTLRRHQDAVFEMGSLCQRRSHQVSVAARHCRGSRTEASTPPVFNNPLAHDAR
jgi:hypothetical protein